MQETETAHTQMSEAGYMYSLFHSKCLCCPVQTVVKVSSRRAAGPAPTPLWSMTSLDLALQNDSASVGSRHFVLTGHYTHACLIKMVSNDG